MIDVIMKCYKQDSDTLLAINKLIENTKMDFNLIFVKGERSASENANIALERCKSEFIASIDDDSMVPADWLTLMVATMKGHPDIGAVSARITGPEGQAQNLSSGITDVREVPMLGGPCYLVRKSVLDMGVKFSEDYRGSQYEDTDFFQQIKHTGYKLFVDGRVHVKHLLKLRASNPHLAHNKEVYERRCKDMNVDPYGFIHWRP